MGMTQEIRRGGKADLIKDRLRPHVPARLWETAKNTKDRLISRERKYPYRKSIVIGAEEVKFTITSEADQYLLDNMFGEQQFFRRLVDSIQPNDVVYDIGASIGTHSIPISALCRAKLVIAFEPNPRAREALQENIVHNNGPTAILVSEYALWKEDRDDLFLDDPHTHFSHTSESSRTDSSINNIKGRRIDTLVSTGTSPPDVVKIDVEGSELEVLEGLGSLVTPRDMLIEIHRARNVTLGQVKELLLPRGHSLVYEEERGDQLLTHFSLDKKSAQRSYF